MNVLPTFRWTRNLRKYSICLGKLGKSKTRYARYEAHRRAIVSKNLELELYRCSTNACLSG
jgi:hypothetical protein